MTALYTIAYPFLNESDRLWIESFRSAHDRSKQKVIAAHFTLVFGTTEVSVGSYQSHVESVVRATSSIRFCFRYAMVCADQHNDSAYIFLVPDEGYAAISKLHDLFYTGPLTSSLRLAFPYIPHITIGYLPSQQEAKRLCDVVNEQNLEIAGVINAITIGSIKDGTFGNVARYSLR
jgi:2'-5' RNA ligase